MNRGHDEPERWRPKAKPEEKRYFSVRASAGAVIPAPFYLDNRMHDLRLERFLKHERRDRFQLVVMMHAAEMRAADDTMRGR